MLTRLTIKNYALIRELDIDLTGGFEVITGETGAGKSILLGALSLILGQRAETSLLSEKDKKCVVEGTFRITGYTLEPFFRKNDLDWQEITLIRREISPNGTSRAFINDTPVTLSLIRELGEKLVNIHSQYQTLTLNEANFQMTVVDHYAGIIGQVNAYREQFDQLTHIKTSLQKLNEQENKSRAELEYFQFLFEELEKAQLLTGEQEQVERDLQIGTNAEEIKSCLYHASQSVLHNDTNILDQLRELIAGLSRSVRYYPDLQILINRLTETSIELKDIALEIDRIESQITFDPQRISALNDRIDLINKLEHKHHAGSVEELLALKDDLSEKILSRQSLAEKIEQLKSEAGKLEEELNRSAREISMKRKEILPGFEKEIIRLLQDLGMPDARFTIEQTPVSSLTRDGLDQLTFLFNANRGGDMKEISGVASGGERSRLMLVLKSLIARKNLLPTIIFDEIDMGISGEVAGKMGTILKRMAEFMQVIVITHLPQIASKAESHYLVFKTADIFSTQTFLRRLSAEERLQEIAKMLSDQKVTDSAIMAARELLKNKL
ncbi:MAG TPA: DNA repair protein RecN [Bacteroidales bacterium]|nr:DNA repair protein RecN [Bacteroidales bacterium]HRZ21079.1 DNA repair protein RecN [Bacteroidales bacterium]